MNVPVNAADGTLMKKSFGIGNQTPGRIPGNVKFAVKRQLHPTFWSEKNDLYTVMTVSIEEALFGFTKTLKVLTDDSVVTVNKSGKTTQGGEVMKVAKRGRKCQWEGKKACKCE